VTKTKKKEADGSKTSTYDGGEWTAVSNYFGHRLNRVGRLVVSYRGEVVMVKQYHAHAIDEIDSSALSKFVETVRMGGSHQSFGELKFRKDGRHLNDVTCILEEKVLRGSEEVYNCFNIETYLNSAA